MAEALPGAVPTAPPAPARPGAPAGPRKYKVTGFGGLKLYPPLLKWLSVEGLVAVKRRKDLTVSYSPFGWVDEGGTVFIKGAPELKYLTEDEIRRIPKGYSRGLDTCKSLTRRHKEKGVVIVNINGRFKRMPRKAYEMMREGRRRHLIVGAAVAPRSSV